MRTFLSPLAALCLLFASHSLFAESLNVVHSGKWPPYSDVALPGQGLGVDLVTTALKRAGYTVYLNTDSWERNLEGGKLGVYDVVATAWYSDERNQYLDFSKPYLKTYVRFIKRKDSDFEFNDLGDLKGMMIGVLTDYAYDDAFNQSRDIIKIPERNLIQNLLKLKQGRIDLTLDDDRVLRYQINRYMPNSMKDFAILPKPLAERGIYIGVSRENPHHAKIVADFNKAIEAMKKDGTYDRILAKHRAYIDKPAP
ncbi:MAG TPA: amino acid ABC transporter substrate-binding protein [Gammaproteobacteria bacterium]|nr:amino acid ABC transporter substrate-binding protein [Gammaproteobacteria bacterium]